MADQTVVVCDVLCFLKHKFGCSNVKVLKMALLDFYDVEVLSSAKVRLVNDISELKSPVKFPNVSRRRDGDNRLAREVDDLISLFTVLDENKLIFSLPRYVADGPDSMPPIRLYEGELNGVMKLIKRLSDQVDEYASVLAAVTKELRLLQARCAPLTSTSTSACGGQVNAQPTTMAHCVQPLAPRSAVTQASRGDQITIANNWAVMASTPNRYAVLSNVDTDDPEAFEEVRQRKKRARKQTSPQTVSQQPNQSQQRQRAATIAGRSNRSDMRLSAASKIRKRAVFCIDNLNTSCTADDVKYFVSNELCVEVISCFDTKPRRRRGEETPTDRKAFRLCVHDDDRDRLLNSTAWPDSVLVAEWFFKGRAQGVEVERQPAPAGGRISTRLPATGGDISTVEGDADETSNCTAVGVVDVVEEIHMEGEDTILVTHSSNTSDDDGSNKV